MNDDEKTEEQHLHELAQLRHRIAELEKIEATRKRAEEALRESEEKYRTWVEQSLQGLVVVQDFRIVFTNIAFAEIFGYTVEELLSLSPEEVRAIVHPEDQALVWGRFQDCLAGKPVPPRYEYRGIRKDGTMRWLEMFARHIKYHAKPAVQATFVDIADRKQAEVDRARLLKELEAKNRELERFTYTVSHDLRSPLVTIQGFTAMLQQDIEHGNRENVKTNLQYISRAASKMDELLSATLKLSRIGRIANPPEDMPFGTIVEGALMQTAGDLRAHAIVVSVAQDLPVVHVDRMRIEEALVNLITNSIKYRGAQPHPKIEIGHRKDGRETVFFVKDNGFGIDKSEQDNVFDLFYRVDKSTEGTGAGLAIVKRIIEAHGGRIWIESELGKGCTVCFTLPLSAE